MCHLSHMEDFIKEFYMKIGIISPQQLQFKEIARKLGINVFFWSNPSQALFINNNAYIFLNEQQSEQQIWQDFNHELGHVLLHVGNQLNMTVRFREYQEYKANQFMYHASVPTFMLDNLNIQDFTHKSICHVQRLFNVEYAFALKRLEQYFNKKLLFQKRIDSFI